MGTSVVTTAFDRRKEVANGARQDNPPGVEYSALFGPCRSRAICSSGQSSTTNCGPHPPLVTFSQVIDQIQRYFSPNVSCRRHMAGARCSQLMVAVVVCVV